MGTYTRPARGATKTAMRWVDTSSRASDEVCSSWADVSDSDMDDEPPAVSETSLAAGAPSHGAVEDGVDGSTCMARNKDEGGSGASVISMVTRDTSPRAGGSRTAWSVPPSTGAAPVANGFDFLSRSARQYAQEHPLAMAAEGPPQLFLPTASVSPTPSLAVPSRMKSGNRLEAGDGDSPIESTASDSVRAMSAASDHRWLLALTSPPNHDFSEILSAAARASMAISQGSARAERPYRAGVSGTYFIKKTSSSRNVLAVFKPLDEETAGTELPLRRKGWYFHAAEGAYKECAAYLLDHDGFASVPQTALARCDLGPSLGPNPVQRTKCGAFQVYHRNLGDADDFGPGVFDTEAVQRIAAFDIRVLQCDRNASNILVCETRHVPRRAAGLPSVARAVNGDDDEVEETDDDDVDDEVDGGSSTASRAQYQLVAIDHGYILPDGVPTLPRACWMDWSQAREPVAPAVRRYIECLDALSDVSMLRRELGADMLRPGSLRSLCIGTMLLKRGVAAGLTLYEIGILIYGEADTATSTSSGSGRLQESAATTEGGGSDRTVAWLGACSKLEQIVSEAEYAACCRATRLWSGATVGASDIAASQLRTAAAPLPDADHGGVFLFEEQLQPPQPPAAAAGTAAHPCGTRRHGSLSARIHAAAAALSSATDACRADALWTAYPLGCAFDDLAGRDDTAHSRESLFFYHDLARRMDEVIARMLAQRSSTATGVSSMPPSLAPTANRRSAATSVAADGVASPPPSSLPTGVARALLRRNHSDPNLLRQPAASQ
eukprot:ctg_1304.g411